MDELTQLLSNMNLEPESVDAVSQGVSGTKLDPFYNDLEEMTDSLAKISISDTGVTLESKQGKKKNIILWRGGCGLEFLDPGFRNPYVDAF